MARQFGSIRKLPSGRYQARFRDPAGNMVPAPMTFTTKRAADSWLAQTQSDIERGRWQSPEQVAAEAAEVRASQMTVRELAEVWLDTIESDNHRVLSASRVRRFINPELGDIAVAELTRDRCDRWYADLTTTLCPGAPTQQRRTYAALHAMLKLAVHQDLIANSPLRVKGALIDIPAREPQTATADEVDRLAAAMPTELALTVQLAAWCGLRTGEVLGLQVADVTEDRSVTGTPSGVVRLQLRRHVVHGRGVGAMRIVDGTKSDAKTASVVVPPHLLPQLQEHIEQHARKTDPAWLFPGTRTLDLPAGPSTLHHRWVQAREQCELGHLTFHDLRRTGNTLAALAGATPGEMKQRLRHRTSSAAERYIVAARGADVELAQRMSAAVTGPEVDPIEVEVQRRVEAEVERRVIERLRELGLES